jgi:hypothetical protein
MRICDIKNCNQEAKRRVEQKVIELNIDEIMEPTYWRLFRGDLCEEHLKRLDEIMERFFAQNS